MSLFDTKTKDKEKKILSWARYDGEMKQLILGYLLPCTVLDASRYNHDFDINQQALNIK